MDERLLGEAIEALILLRMELHGSVDDSVLETIDKVISDLDAARDEPRKISAYDALRLLGSVLDKLPVIVEILRILLNVFK